MSISVLFADDDEAVRQFVAYGLQLEGLAVSLAADGEQAVERWQQDAPDLLLLDVRMPKLDGLEVLRRIRQVSDLPVILVTGLTRDQDAVRGLDLGADDYVSKPFSLPQLAARIRAVLRRTRAGRPTPAEVQAAGISLELDSRLACRNGRRVRLTPLESRIFHPLLLNAGQVVPSEELLELAWQERAEGDSVLLQAHISHIRKKLDLRKGEPGYIQAVSNLGYVLNT
jgi:DNA-binding response OmpR family regulator